MKAFLDKDFLLKNETAKTLYHDYAADMPIIDYHCHINPQEIFEDKCYENITQVWMKNILPEAPAIMKSSASMQRLWNGPSEIRCITGATWN